MARAGLGHNGGPRWDEPSLSRRAFLGGAAVASAAGAAQATTIHPALLFYGHVQKVHYSAPISSVDSALAISALFNTAAVVELDVGGVYYGLANFNVPAGRTLLCQGSTLKLRPTSTITNVIRIFGTVEDAVIDGSMAERIAVGYNRFCHGALIRNAQNASLRRATITGAGDALVNGYTSLSAVGMYIDRDDNATADTLNCYAEDVTIDDSAGILPFGARIASDFVGHSEGDFPYWNRNSRFTRLTIIGTVKNALETVGCNTTAHLVENCTVRNPLGQGCIEADFGANYGTYQYNLVDGFGSAGTLLKTCSAFNARTTDRTGIDPTDPIKRSHDNTFISNRVTNGIIRNAFHIYAREDAGSLNTTWVNHQMDNMTVESGAGRIVGHSMDSSVFPITGMRDSGADISTATHAMMLYGSNGANDVQWSSGSFSASDRGFWNSSSSPLVNVKLASGLQLTAPTLIDAKGPFQVDGATLSGTSVVVSGTPSDLTMINTTLTLPAAAMTALTTAVPSISDPGSNNTLIST